MKISVIHPSRGRPKQAYETYRKWVADGNCDNPLNINYYLSIDIDQIDIYKEAFKRSYIFVHFVVNDNQSAIQAINNAAKITTGDLFVVISDDFDCEPGWDTSLLNFIGDKEDFLLKTNDCLQKTLVTLPILDRKYYNRFGYIYHPDFKHMHCDEEMTIVALMLGRYIKCDLKFEHLHYSTGKTKYDAINEKNNNTWQHGQRILDEHAKNNFGIINPLIKREDIIWK